jgi:ABC-type antimicrobial peptide transport system permease subunit
MAHQNFAATVLGALGSLTTILAVLGVYVLADSHSRRRQRELGVRVALGAKNAQLVLLMLKDTATLITAGSVVGLLLAWAAGHLIRGFLFGVQPFDPLTLALVVGTLSTLALAVSLRPAMRATRVDVARVLRAE